MPYLQLTGGAYQSRSIIAAAQRCLNLYPEPTPAEEGEPARCAHIPTPGLRILATLPQGPVRGILGATNGRVYVVAGSGVYSLSPAWVPTLLGSITAGLTTPVGMADNGLDLVIVDGTSTGWHVTLATNLFAAISDPTGSFRGADRVDYLDTFFLFNVPGTPQFESSLSLALTFDPLYFANKEAHSDLLVSIAVARREIWLIGQTTTEIWFNSGAPDFPFQAMQGAFVDHGTCAKYSIAVVDNQVLWLSRDRQGQGIVLKGEGYNAVRVSTFAIEQAIAGYAVISDAVAHVRQHQGHSLYVLSFPTADKTWAFDLSTELWHELAWIDPNGAEHRHRVGVSAPGGGLVLGGDWQNGNLYAIDPEAQDDAGQPIKRQRSFPHMRNGGNRVFYRQLIADMEVGTSAGSTDATAPIAYLEWSDDRGVSFGNPVAQSMGAAGEYKVSMQWQRLGMARDRVFRITWSTPNPTSLLGAWVDFASAAS